MSNLNIRPLRKSEEKEFLELTTHYIGIWYDDIDESFAQNILDTHNKGFDPFGYFTKTKTIWVAEADDQMRGFLVSTEKRGGSVKFAPGIVKEKYQKQRVGTNLWMGLEEIFRKKQFRKIYNHAPFERFDLLKWVTGLGLRVEANLKSQYRKDQYEYVAGKLITKNSSYNSAPIPWKNKEIKYQIREYENTDEEQFKHIILAEMPQWYNEIDNNFVNSIIKAKDRYKEKFRSKGKKIFIIESEGDLIGCCITSPKRGGSVKLSPYLISSEKANYEMGRELLTAIEDFYKSEGYRKLYAPIPVLDLGSCETFRIMNFEIEGIIREPYKEGIDNFFFGKILRVSS